MVVGVFLEEKADVFGLVSGETFAVDEDAGVEAVRFALEDEGAVGCFVNVGVGLDGLEAALCDGRFWVVFFELDAEAGVEGVEILVAEFAAVPVILGELGVVEVFGGDAVDVFVELGDFGFGFGGFFVGASAFDVAAGDVFDGEIFEVFLF